MTKATGWKIERHEPSVFSLSAGASHRILVISDLHWDNRHCDRAALKRDIDEAVAGGWPIVIVGDLFCAMQGKWDKRADDRQLRPEHRGGTYFDKLINTAAEWFLPYAQNIALITYGNHETSIIAHHNTDLLQRFHQELKHRAGSKFKGELGSYAGFLKVQTKKADKKNDEGYYINKVIAWHHGSGGGGEVTRGMIDNSRMRGMMVADIYIGGHIHRRNADENKILELDERQMKVRQRQQWFIRASTYKKETGIDEQDLAGFHVEKHGPGERPVGGWWLEFESTRERHGNEQTYDVKIRPIPTWG